MTRKALTNTGRRLLFVTLICLCQTFLSQASDPSPTVRPTTPEGLKYLTPNQVRFAGSMVLLSTKIEMPHWARKLWAIAIGQQQSETPASQTRYDWKWVVSQFDTDEDQKVTSKELNAPPEVFARLDRNRDSVLTSDDFDWSPRGQMARQSSSALQIFREVDTDSNGQVSDKEWQAFYEQIKGEKKYLSDEDFLNFLYPPSRQGSKTGQGSGTGKGSRSGGGVGGSGLQARWSRLTKMMERGTLFNEGPNVGQPAPNFTLSTRDGKQKIELSQLHNRKPVVLVFGSFT